MPKNSLPTMQHSKTSANIDHTRLRHEVASLANWPCFFLPNNCTLTFKILFVVVVIVVIVVIAVVVAVVAAVVIFVVISIVVTAATTFP